MAGGWENRPSRHSSICAAPRERLHCYIWGACRWATARYARKICRRRPPAARIARVWRGWSVSREGHAVGCRCRVRRGRAPFALAALAKRCAHLCMCMALRKGIRDLLVKSMRPVRMWGGGGCAEDIHIAHPQPATHPMSIVHGHRAVHSTLEGKFSPEHHAGILGDRNTYIIGLSRLPPPIYCVLCLF